MKSTQLALCLFVFGIATTASRQASAEALVWFVNPDTGQIQYVSASTGELVGSFTMTCEGSPWSCTAPAADNHDGGLAIANGGTTLLYQAYVDAELGGQTSMLYQIDPYTGIVVGPETEIALGGTKLGLGWTPTDLLFYAHAVEGTGDIHRDEEFWGPYQPSEFSFLGPIGGDGTSRQFAVYRASAEVGCQSTMIDPSQTFIGEFDPFDNDGADGEGDADTFIRCYLAPADDIVGLAATGHRLFASTASGLLYTLDPNTGAVINVVSLPASVAPYLSDIAAVPEPGLLALFALGLGAGSRALARARRPRS